MIAGFRNLRASLPEIPELAVRIRPVTAGAAEKRLNLDGFGATLRNLIPAFRFETVPERVPVL
jgi:hypothetical protein